MIYLDNAATTFPKPEIVYKAVDEGMREYSFNAGRGAYAASRLACKAIDATRRKVGLLARTPNSHVVFTSSATEALNEIIYGLCLGEGDVVYVSPFEHNAIVRPLHRLVSSCGVVMKLLPFDERTWEFDESEFKAQLSVDRVKAVFVSHVSNVTGYVLPYQAVFSCARAAGAVTVLDASQSFGVLDVDASISDYIVFAGHKSLYGPFGVAGFIMNGEHRLAPVKAGGTGSDSLNPEMPSEIPFRYEAGSPNVVAIKGLSAALDWLKVEDVKGVEEDLTRYLLQAMAELPSLKMFLPQVPDVNLFSIVSFVVPGYTASQVGEILDEEFDIAVRTGYHCAPFVHNFIHSREYYGTIRVSIGYFNTRDDIDKLIQALQSL